MKTIEAALRELKENLYILDIIALFVNTLIAFLASLLFLIILNFPWTYALFPALAYFLILFIRRWNISTMPRVEARVPELSEQLRTAEDNLDKENTVTTLLNEDVVQKMRKIKTSLFVNMRDFTIKSTTILLLSLLIITLSILNVNFDAKLAAQEAAAPLKNLIRQPGQDIPKVDLASLREGNLTGIFGNRSLAKPGDQELTLTLNPLQSEINLDDVRNAEKQDFTPPDFPKEIYTSYENAYTENVPKENQKLIKRYFQQITQ